MCHTVNHAVALISSTASDQIRAVSGSEAWNKSDEKTTEGRQAIWRASVEVIVIFLVLIVAFSTDVPLAVHPLDERMMCIINGILRLTAFVVLALLSVRVAIWVGLCAPCRFNCTQTNPHAFGKTLVELQHRVRGASPRNSCGPSSSCCCFWRNQMVLGCFPRPC